MSDIIVIMAEVEVDEPIVTSIDEGDIEREEAKFLHVCNLHMSFYRVLTRREGNGGLMRVLLLYRNADRQRLMKVWE